MVEGTCLENKRPFTWSVSSNLTASASNKVTANKAVFCYQSCYYIECYNLNMKTTNPCTACESCLMPFSKDPGVRENERYCSYCYKNGKLCYEGNDLKEFQKICYEQMRKDGLSWPLAKFYTYMIRFAPRWKQSKK